jgi:hypothetical protein
MDSKGGHIFWATRVGDQAKLLDITNLEFGFLRLLFSSGSRQNLEAEGQEFGEVNHVNATIKWMMHG